MVKFRLFSIIDSSNSIKKLSELLDKNRIYNYGIEQYIPRDVPSVNYDDNKLIINIPNDLNDCQYDVTDLLRSMRLRNRVSYDRSLIRMDIIDNVNLNQAYTIVTSIIDLMGYTIICPI